MAKFKRINTKERRAGHRVSAAKVVPTGITRLSTGQEVKLINISHTGAVLIHSNVVLAPGSYVRLKLKIPGLLINMDGRIQRCRAIALKQGKVKYETAVVLDGGLPQELAERLHFLDEGNPQSETISLAELNPEMMRMPDKSELWILSSQES